MEWARVPLEAVMVTVYVPADPLQEIVEAAEVPRVTVPGFRVQTSPLVGDTDRTRLRVPANPSTLVAVILDVPAAPAVEVMLEELAPTAKSWTVKSIIVE